MRNITLSISILATLCSQSALGMRSSRAVHAAYTPWPPLLWIAHETPIAVAERLKQHNISVYSYVCSQLMHARKQTLGSIKELAHLTNDDMLKIKAITKKVRLYDAQAAKVSFLKRLPRKQQRIRDKIPVIDWIAKQCKIDTDFEIILDPDMPLEVYYTRPMHTIIFDIEGYLMLPDPQHGILAQPQLILGRPYDHLPELQQHGALARQIGGHMHLEHATERYLFKEVMKKRKVTSQKAGRPLTLLHELHALEADLYPAAKNIYLAECILEWLESQEEYSPEPFIEQRIRNVAAVHDVMVALKHKQ